VKVIDFGVAKLADSDPSQLSERGTTMGTPAYMPLEQLRGSQDLDGRADLYAFGVMLYEAVTGQRPYAGLSLPELALEMGAAAAAPVAALRPELPALLARIVDRAVARERDQRWPQLRALIDALRPFCCESGFAGAPAGQTAALLRLHNSGARSNTQPGAAAVPPALELPVRISRVRTLHAGEPPDTFAPRALAGPARSGRVNRAWACGMALALLGALALHLRASEPHSAGASVVHSREPRHPLAVPAAGARVPCLHAPGCRRDARNIAGTDPRLLSADGEGEPLWHGAACGRWLRERAGSEGGTVCADRSSPP